MKTKIKSNKWNITKESIVKEYIEKRKPQLVSKISGTVFYIEKIN